MSIALTPSAGPSVRLGAAGPAPTDPLASLRLPALRDDLALLPAPAGQDGAPGWTIHDPVRNRYFRIGPEAFATADWVLRSWLGDLVLLLSLWALWYHALAGIRHLVWSTGRMMEIHTAERFGQIIFALSFVLTALTVLILWTV